MKKFDFKIGRLWYFGSVISLYLIIFQNLPLWYLIPGTEMNLGLDTGASPNDFSQVMTNYLIISAILLFALMIIQAMRLRDCNLPSFISIPMMSGWICYFVYTLSPYGETFPNYKYSEIIVKTNEFLNYQFSAIGLICIILTLVLTLLLFFYSHREKKKESIEKKSVLSSLNIPKKKLVLLLVLALLLICGFFLI